MITAASAGTIRSSKQTIQDMDTEQTKPVDAWEPKDLVLPVPVEPESVVGLVMVELFIVRRFFLKPHRTFWVKWAKDSVVM